MNVDIKSGKYIVAVSGGVDSVVLLDILVDLKGLEPLTIAHFDHGIRPDSTEDRKFVATMSQKYNLPFEFAEGKLGEKTSEEHARKARYEFLQQIRKKYGAIAIITAHHQDDVLETILLNLLRGTARKGLTSLASTTEIIRPLLNVSKKEIQNYAKQHGLTWREDSTNANTAYLRNNIRHNLVPKLTAAQRKHLLSLHTHMKAVNTELDTILESLLDKDNRLSKKLLSNLSHTSALELAAVWLRQNSIRDFDSNTLERLVIGAKTLQTDKIIPVKHGFQIIVHNDNLELEKA